MLPASGGARELVDEPVAVAAEGTQDVRGDEHDQKKGEGSLQRWDEAGMGRVREHVIEAEDVRSVKGLFPGGVTFDELNALLGIGTYDTPLYENVSKLVRLLHTNWKALNANTRAQLWNGKSRMNDNLAKPY